MEYLSLNGAWQLETEDGQQIPAAVPGSVLTDLLKAGEIPDPFWRDNELTVLPLMEREYRYSRVFDVPEIFLSHEHVFLRCHGLDTLASLTINGLPAGKADNMHRTWLFDGKHLLKPGQNEICISFASPTKYIRKAYAAHHVEGTEDAMEGFPFLRKAHCMFGWDWGPRLPDCGIWRDIELMAFDSARIRDVLIRQKHEDRRVTLSVNTRLERYDSKALTVIVKFTAPDGRTYTGQGTDCSIRIEDPKLWWPAGFGDQPLYRVDVSLIMDGSEQDHWSNRIGLRTLTVCREKDPDGKGESFCHIVNGVKLFAMGADYIPEDNLLARCSPERTRRLLEDARLANMNTIRVWGGGCYPDDRFYAICDELGLLVWQDFMFACAVYDLTEEFDQNIRAEVTENVRRLRHHPSLALWCGNNEMEDFVRQGNWVTEKKQAADYIKMYEYIFPEILKQEDPDTFYWPSSPSSGGSFDEPNSPNRGDVHYWEVWHGLKPFTEYRKFLFRYVSEFGFQSFPCMATIRSFTEPEDRNPFSYVMEKHQHNAGANGRIAEYLSQTYLYPTTFEAFVYASQLLQAQAMQYGVEHWRRHRGHCMGAVIWQLNDCWPVVSWSSIDWYGRWKALHYYEKRFFAPVLISCHEEGILSQNTNVNAEHFPDKMTARLNVSNETREMFLGTANWSLRRPDGSVIESGSFEVIVPPLSAVWLSEAQDFSRYGFYDCYYAYELLDTKGNLVGSGTVLFCAPKHFHFTDPELTAQIEGDEVVVTARAYARSVEIQCGADVVLEDNFFDMNAGSRRVKILRGSPEVVTVRSVFDIR